MMSAQQYILMKIAEEASEVAQRALKAQQFGVDQTEPGRDRDNAERLCDELTDLSIWAAIATKIHILPKMTSADLIARMQYKAPVLAAMLELAVDEGQVEPMTMEF